MGDVKDFPLSPDAFQRGLLDLAKVYVESLKPALPPSVEDEERRLFDEIAGAYVRLGVNGENCVAFATQIIEGRRALHKQPSSNPTSD